MKIVLVQMEPEIPGFSRGDFTCLNGLKSLALASIGALLRKEGFEVKIIQQGVRTNDEALHAILADRPDWVCFSSMSYDFPAALDVIGKLPASVSIMIGGPHITTVPEQLPERENCFGVIGEGEQTVLNLLKDSPDTRGTCFWEKGKIKINPRHPRIENLDALPFGIPSTEIIAKPFVGKLMLPAVHAQVNTEVTVAQRGCGFNCSFCSSWRIWGCEVVARSVENVVREFDAWQERGVNCAFLSDLTTNVRPDYLKSLCRALIASGNKIRIYTMFRLADEEGRPMFDEEMIALAAGAGIVKIGVGLESFSLDTQKRYRKVYDISIARQFFRWCDKHGILTKGFCIISPEDDEGSIRTSRDTLEFLEPDEIRSAFEDDFSPAALRKAAHDNNLQRLHTDEPFLPGKMSLQQQLAARRWERKSYYEGLVYRAHVSQKIQNFPELLPAYAEYFEHLGTLGVKVSIF